MTKVTKSVFLSAEPTRIIDYIAGVGNHPAFISALKKVENIKGDPKQSGSTWDWTFVMAGVEVKGKAEGTGCTPGKSFGFRTTTGIKSTFNYRVEPAKGGATLTLDVDYEVPQNVLAKIVDKAVVERMNEEEGERTVKNLKTIFEGE